MRLKKVVANGIVLLASFTIGLFLCEAGSKLFLNPADYLTVSLVRDDILGIKIAPGSSGFDKWGFRNHDVPPKVDVVAIGDSHTYGNNATMDDSWPYVAGRQAGLSVYNLGLGGYGPNQYYHLLKTYALQLKPRWIICGLYLGDDFENAFLITYGKEPWSFLRSGDWGPINADIWETSEGDQGGFRSIRYWLSRNSILYRLAFHTSALANLKAAFQIKQASDNESVASLNIPEVQIQEAFLPIQIGRNLDQHSAPVREGMRITFELLDRMGKASRENGIQFAVVLIPTKETVFADYLLASPQPRLKGVIGKLIADEQSVRSQLVDFFNKAGIPYVDALPALRRQLTNHLYTRSDRDMHPSENGYGVIGQSVAEFLKHH
jgi:hypothetical protein